MTQINEAATGQVAPAETSEADPRRWLALAVIAIAQLMVVLDATIVNIAMPSAQQALHITDANRQWIVTAYTLAFGGLLLLGGRIADYVGRKRIFLIGAISGVGAAIGLIMGGLLTEYTSWRWCLLVNIPIALIAFFLALPIVRESRAHGNTRYDVPGAVLATGGLLALVYGFTKAAEDGWSAGNTLTYFGIAAVLLVGFVVVEARSANPLLPLRVVLHRNRGGSFLVSVLLGAGMLGMFLFMTYYFQGTLHYSPLRSGVAYLPFSGGLIVTAIVGSWLLPRVGARAMMTAGGILATSAMVWLTQLRIDSSYQAFILPAFVIMAVGMALVFVPLGNTSLTGVSDHDAGVASAMVNTTQQVGASLGVALLNTVFTNATTSYIQTHGPASAPLAAVHGYNVAFTASAALLAASALATFALIRNSRQPDITPPEPVEAPVLAGVGA